MQPPRGLVTCGGYSHGQSPTPSAIRLREQNRVASLGQGYVVPCPHVLLKIMPRARYEVVTIHPHDPGAFTEGLVFLDGALLKSTGLHGQSSLRKVELKTGRVLKHIEVPEQYFAEGLAVLADKIFQLTWQDHKGFVYDLESLRLEREFPCDGEGWGLTTERIRFFQATGFAGDS